MIVKTFSLDCVSVMPPRAPPPPPLLHRLSLHPLPRCRVFSEWRHTQSRPPPERILREEAAAATTAAENHRKHKLAFNTTTYTSPYAPPPPKRTPPPPKPPRKPYITPRKSVGAPPKPPANRFKKQPDYEAARYATPLRIRGADGNVCRGCGIPLQVKDRNAVGFKYMKNMADRKRAEQSRKRLEDTIYFQSVRGTGTANIERLANTEERLERREKAEGKRMKRMREQEQAWELLEDEGKDRKIGKYREVEKRVDKQEEMEEMDFEDDMERNYQLENMSSEDLEQHHQDDIHQQSSESYLIPSDLRPSDLLLPPPKPPKPTLQGDTNLCHRCHEIMYHSRPQPLGPLLLPPPPPSTPSSPPSPPQTPTPQTRPYTSTS